MRKFLLLLLLSVATNSFGVTYYIDFASGSDGNAGTSKSGPWQYAPGMAGCASNCAAYVNNPGDQFIFKGGVQWDQTIVPWDIKIGGSASAGNTYFGVDQTWWLASPSGSSPGCGASTWCQPIFDGGSPSSGAPLHIVNIRGNYLTFDNFLWQNFGIPGLNQGTIILLFMDDHDVLVENMTFHPNARSAINYGNGTGTTLGNFEVKNSDFANLSWGMYVADEAGTSSAIVGVKIHNNSFHDFHSQMANGFHGDAIFLSANMDGAPNFPYVPNQYLDQVYIYDNQFYGDFSCDNDSGNCSGASRAGMSDLVMASWTLKGSCWFYNNTIAYNTSSWAGSSGAPDVLVTAGGPNGPFVSASEFNFYNNSINVDSSCVDIFGVSGAGTVYLYNNVGVGCLYPLGLGNGADGVLLGLSASDYNDWYGWADGTSGHFAGVDTNFFTYAQFQQTIGPVTSIAVSGSNLGSGYVVGDLVATNSDTGNPRAHGVTAQVTSVSAAGGVTGLSLVSGGFGNATTTGVTTVAGASGTCNPPASCNAASALTDSTANFIPNNLIYSILKDVTDGSSCQATGNTATVVYCTLAGGTHNYWSSGDAYHVGPTGSGLKVNITVATPAGYEAHGLNVNPLYQTSTDLNPEPTSPLNNAGINLYPLFTTDILGNPLPSTGPWPIGAYECEATECLTSTVTIASSPSGESFTVTGAAGCATGSYSTPQTLDWSAAPCTVQFTWPVSNGTGAQLVFSQWADGNTSNPRTITTPASASTFTANFVQQYQATTAVSPAGGGTVTTPASGTYLTSGTATTLTASANAGYAFNNWSVTSGSATFDNANSASTTVTLSSGPATVQANFAVSATIASMLDGIASTGLSFSVSGTGCQPGSYNTQQVLAWVAGSSCTVTFTTPQGIGSSTQYAFTQWDDNASTSNSRTITAPASATTYTGDFTTQYLLTTAVSPAGAGNPTPSTPTYYNKNSTSTIQATPNSGYFFSNWTTTGGAVTSPTSASTTVTLSAPTTVTANFNVGVTITTSPGGMEFTVDSTLYPSGTTVFVTPGFVHTLGVPTPQSGGAGTQYVFTQWPDSVTDNPRSVLLSAPASLTADFNTQYQLTTAVSPAGDGTVTTPTSGTFLNSGVAVSLSATANAGFNFNGWSVTSGSATFANANSASTTVTLSSGPATVTANFQATSFGSVNVCPGGQTTPAPCSQTLTLNYSVNSDTTFGAINVLTQGAPNLDFTPNGTTCTGTVTAGNSCTVGVTFAPLAPGLRMGAVQLTDSTGNLLATIFVQGEGQGPAIAFGPSAQTTVPASGPSSPWGVAVDAAGDVFIANTGANQVVEVPAGGGTQTTLTVSVNGQGLNGPQGVAVDGAGDLFIADNGNSRVVEIPAGGGAQTTVGGGLSAPTGVAADGAGDVFIADIGLNQVVEVPAGGGAQTTVGSGLSSPYGVAVDGAGDVFIANAGANQMVEVPAGGGAQTTVGSGLSSPYGVAVDGAGDLFIADNGNSRVVEVPAGGGAQTTVGSGLSAPAGVALDGGGDVLVADIGLNQVVEVQRSQPPTLSFAPTAPFAASTDSPKSVTVQNIGNQSLNAVSPGLGIGSTSFVQVPGSGTPPDCTSGFSLAPGASCNLSVSFTPQTTGSIVSAATFTDNALNATTASQSIPLQGTGLMTPTVTFTAAPYIRAYQGTFTVASTTNSSSPPVYTSSGVCSNSGAVYTMTSGTGTCTSTVTWAADSNYAAATLSQTTIADTIAPTVTFTGAPASLAYQGTFTVASTTNSSSSPVYTSSGVCSSSGAVYTMTSGTGTCTSTVTWAADSNYAAATLSQTTIADTIAPTVTFTGAPTSLAYQGTFTVASTTNSSSSPVYTSSGVCSNSGAVYTMTSGTGTCTSTVTWAADSNYAAATLSQTTIADTIAPTVTFTGAPASLAYQGTFTVASTTNSSSSPVYTSSGSCSNVGATYTMTRGSNDCYLRVTWAADTNYAWATLRQTTMASKIAPTVTFTGAPGSLAYQGTFTVSSSTNSSKPPVYTASGVCYNSGALYTMKSGTGTCTSTVTWADDANYTGATLSQTTTASTSVQTITFTQAAPSSANYKSTFAVAADSTSGLKVVFSVDAGSTGVCSLTGRGVTMLSGAGTCTIDANQAGNANYSAATQQQTSATAQTIGQTISFTRPAPSIANYKSTFAVAADSTSGLKVVFSLDAGSTGVCSLTGRDVTMLSGTGTCTIDANQAGNANYSAATQQQTSATAQTIGQTISFTRPAPSSASDNSTFPVAAKSTSRLAVALSVDAGSTSVCSLGTPTTVSGVTSATVTVVSSTGTCTIDANQAGNGGYSAATQQQTSAVAQ